MNHPRDSRDSVFTRPQSGNWHPTSEFAFWCFGQLILRPKNKCRLHVCDEYVSSQTAISSERLWMIMCRFAYDVFLSNGAYDFCLSNGAYGVFLTNAAYNVTVRMMFSLATVCMMCSLATVHKIVALATVCMMFSLATVRIYIYIFIYFSFPLAKVHTMVFLSLRALRVSQTSIFFSIFFLLISSIAGSAVRLFQSPGENGDPCTTSSRRWNQSLEHLARRTQRS